jgi:hypothetical protein
MPRTAMGDLSSPVDFPLNQGSSGEVIPTGWKYPLPFSYWRGFFRYLSSSVTSLYLLPSLETMVESA